MTVAAAVLAAGRGSRLGGDASKPLLEWRGRPLVAWALDAALASGLAPVVLVAGYRADDVRAAVAAHRSRGAVDVVENPEWEEGIASSLRAVLRLLTPLADIDAVCVGLADQPLVAPRPTGGWRRPTATSSYPSTTDNRATRSSWRVASGPRRWSSAATWGPGRSPGTVRSDVDCTGTGSAADVDTLEDLERLQQEDQ